MELIARHFVWR